ncbi:MAG: GEVED domain-containing protein [Flavobacteriaceae bacterium]|nr:GEVED domain-containing protein [Flavobacteriaceae bacterium]
MVQNLLHLQKIMFAVIIFTFSFGSLCAQVISPNKIDHSQNAQFLRQNTTALTFNSIGAGLELLDTEYCIPALDCTDNDMITSVTFGDISTTSGCSPNGYADNTSMSTTVETGNSYTIAVGVGDGWMNESVSVWIDFNNNFIFETSEFTYIGTGSNNIVSGSISIPSSVEPGEYRMRVRVAAVGASTATGDKACDVEVDYYGETEDYTVIVILGDGEGEEEEEEEEEGCLTGDLYPSSTYTPACIGIDETITTVTWAGEYSNVSVTAEMEYTFSSSIASDFITISNESGTTVFAAGTTPLTWTAPATGVIRYYIHANSNCASEMASRTRRIRCGEIQPAPENDDCENAIPLTCGETATGNTITATNSGGYDGPDVFYSFTGQGSPEYITVSLCESGYDTVVRVFSDCSLSNEIAMNDDACGVQSEVSFMSDGVSTYYIMIEGWNVSSGVYSVTLTCEVPPTPPESCEDFAVASNNLENGLFFGGDTQQRIATDIPVGDTNLTVYGMEPVVINPATYFNFNVFADNSGLPGDLIETRTGNIISSFVTGQNFNFDFIKYTIEFDSPLELSANTTYWIEIETDAIAWESTTRVTSIMGNMDVFSNVNSSFEWQSADAQFVFNFICSTMSVNDLQQASFSYYPNPVKDVLYIKSDHNIKQVEMYNTAGQQVLSKISTVNNSIRVDTLPAGVYIFRVLLDNGKTETMKVIKK